MLMPNSVNFLLERGQRRARELRPATLIWSGFSIPCTTSNLDFFERLTDAGFSGVQNLHITVFRSDLPITDQSGNDLVVEFKRGQRVQVRDDDSGDVFTLTVGDNNTRHSNFFLLNLQTSIV
jgi:hypothetical protein